ncbi:MAG TPA: MFS transporter [Chthonomonadaceae bacterium]|nr:MFS transporter [Chthonomonadaceae bacterium]
MVTEKRAEECRRQTRWNLAALTVDVVFYWVGAAFTDPLTVLLLLMHRLGATETIIGLSIALRLLAQYLPQVFIAHRMHGKARQKPMLVWVVGLARLPLLLLPFLLWNAAKSPDASRTAITAIVIVLALVGLGEGLGAVPWTEIIARAFSDRTRGRFLTGTQITSGILNILIAGFIVRPLLDLPGLPYPHDFAVLIGLSALMFQLSTVGLLLIQEPPPPPDLEQHRPMPPLASYFRLLPKMLHNDPIFARLVTIQILINAGWAASPYYVNYATQRYRLGDHWAGTYQLLQAISIAMLMPIWAYLSEKRSPAAAVRGVAFVCMLTPLAAITLGRLSPWYFGSVFLLMGGSLTAGGIWVVMNHFLLSHASDEERPLFVGLLNLLNVPCALFILLGSLLVRQDRFVEWYGVPVLPALLVPIIGIGFLLSLKLSLSVDASVHTGP